MERRSFETSDEELDVAGLRNCDVGPIAQMMRNDLRYDLSLLVGSVRVPTDLARIGELSTRLGPPRARGGLVENLLRHDTVEVFDTGHGVHREDLEGYVRLLGDWLRESVH